MQILGGTNLHPLYSCIRVREHWFGPPTAEPVLGDKPSGGGVTYTRPELEELLAS